MHGVLKKNSGRTYERLDFSSVEKKGLRWQKELRRDLFELVGGERVFDRLLQDRNIDDDRISGEIGRAHV